MRPNKALSFRIAMFSVAILTMAMLIVGTPRMKATAAGGVFAVTPASAPASPTCYPTCQPNDAKLFALAGSQLFTFAGGATTIGLRVNGASNPSTFTVGIFDGDAGGLWDQDTAGSGAAVTFEIFADANGDGNPDSATPLETLPNASMVDNAFVYFNVSHHAEARTGGAGTDYIYQLKASLPPMPPGLVQNAFKVAADSAQTQLFITPQILSFQGFQNTVAEFLIIHPTGLPNCNPGEAIACAPSNYDGIWDFSFLVDPALQSSVNIWNGDFDIGSVVRGVPNDTDDPTTPNVRPDDPSLGADAFSLQGAIGVNPEGVGTSNDCQGAQPPQGCPPDDSIIDAFRRTTAPPNLLRGVVNHLIQPNGAEFLDINPSGTSEWELFRVSINPGPLVDVVVPSLQSGLWTFRVEGMDLGNLFALRFDKILLVEPFRIGDTVFCDGNRNGVQDPGDTGVAGVLVELLDSANQVLKTTTTNASGIYGFAVEPGTHTVRIAASNFNVGGPLAGLNSTTGGNQQTRTVVNANVLDYDFGYDCTPPPPPSNPPCVLDVPPFVKARPGSNINFLITNRSPFPVTVTVRPFFANACFKVMPGYPQQVVIAGGRSASFLISALGCPPTAGSQPQNSRIIIESSDCPTVTAQVEWVLR